MSRKLFDAPEGVLSAIWLVVFLGALISLIGVVLIHGSRDERAPAVALADTLNTWPSAKLVGLYVEFDAVMEDKNTFALGFMEANVSMRCMGMFNEMMVEYEVAACTMPMTDVVKEASDEFWPRIKRFETADREEYGGSPDDQLQLYRRYLALIASALRSEESHFKQDALHAQ